MNYQKYPVLKAVSYPQRPKIKSGEFSFNHGNISGMSDDAGLFLTISSMVGVVVLVNVTYHPALKITYLVTKSHHTKIPTDS